MGPASGVPSSIPPHLTPPRVLTSVGTVYPPDALRLVVRRQDLGSALALDAAEGTVGLRALVLADGTVDRIDVTTSSGSAELDHAATDAVKRWRFAPARRDDVPIDAYVVLRIRYVVR
ncbi:MAG TPA: energy transducer TonB [bacterium]|nr:energy transducer TonB [bacterium]